MTDKQATVAGMFVILVIVGLVIGVALAVAFSSPPGLEWVPVNAPRADMECWRVQGWEQVVCRW
jgi:hypothetical protein